MQFGCHASRELVVNFCSRLRLIKSSNTKSISYVIHTLLYCLITLVRSLYVNYIRTVYLLNNSP